MTPIIDIHTHNAEALNAIYNLPTPTALHPAGRPVSVGLHPWDTADKTPEELRQLYDGITRRALLDHDVAAIGETGLDNKRGADLATQIEVLCFHIALAQKLGKPLILHVVGAWSELLRIKRETAGKEVAWIIHGFRGKPELARQLLNAGFYLSLGLRYNPASAEIIPSDRLLLESDEADATPTPPPAHYDPLLPSKIFHLCPTK
jgi:TatD DNase family protein